MDRIITIDELARTVAQFTKCDTAEALTFVREMFLLAAETLSEGESVDIKHIGTFAAVDGELRFRPDPDLAAEINAPFAAFSAIEVADPSILDEADKTTEENQPEHQEATEPAPAATEAAEEEKEEVKADSDDSPTSETAEPAAEETSPEPIQPPVKEAEPAVAPHTEAAAPHAPSTPRQERRQTSQKSEWLMPLLLAALCLTVGFVMGRLTAPSKVVTVEITQPVQNTDPQPISEKPVRETAFTADTVPAVKPAAQQPPRVVTDTIRRGRFLTTMARQHYGQMEYWVYIYKENAARLGHPDHVTPGTVVVIPPAEKYGLKAGDANKIAEAKKLASEIYKNH